MVKEITRIRMVYYGSEFKGPDALADGESPDRYLQPVYLFEVQIAPGESLEFAVQALADERFK